jgi:hypothetical protein
MLMTTFNKSFRTLSGGDNFARSFAHIVRNFNIELATVLATFRLRTGVDHYIAFQHQTSGQHICPSCYANFPNRRAGFRGIAETLPGFNPRTTSCTYSNCRVNIWEMQQEMIPEAEPLSLPAAVGPSDPQRELLALPATHVRVYLPQIKILIPDGIKRSIADVFSRCFYNNLQI